MFELFYMGGPLFMGILTILFFTILAIAIFNLTLLIRKDYKDILETRRKLVYLKSIGRFALVTGIMGQLLGLFNAFQAIEKATDISPAILAGGLKVSMITTIYGMLIFLFSYLFWLLLDYYASKQSNS